MSHHVRPEVCPVLSVKLEPRPLMDGCERPGPKPELGLVGLDNVEGSQPVAPLVLDEGAVRAVERPCQSPQRDATALTGTPEGQPQTSLRSRLRDPQARPTLHVSIPSQISDPIVHSLVGLFSDRAPTSAGSAQPHRPGRG